MNSINLRLLFVVLSAAGAPQARILSPYLTDGIASSAIIALVVLASSTIFINDYYSRSAIPRLLRPMLTEIMLILCIHFFLLTMRTVDYVHFPAKMT